MGSQGPGSVLGPEVDRLLQIKGGDLFTRHPNGVDQSIGQPVRNGFTRFLDRRSRGTRWSPETFEHEGETSHHG